MRTVIFCFIIAMISLGCGDTTINFKLTSVDTGIDSSIRAIKAVDSDVVWASGSGGTVFLTVDGGSNWKSVVVPTCEETELRSIYGWNSKRAIVFEVAPTGRAFLTEDGGDSWRVVFSSEEPRAFFNSVAFADSLNGFAISDQIDGEFLYIKSVDAGVSWSRVDNLPKPLKDEGNFAASNSCIEYLASGEISVVTGIGEVARVISSKDFGANWIATSTPAVTGEASGLYSISFLDSDRGVAVGGRYDNPSLDCEMAIYTTDGGATWQLPEVKPREFRSSVLYLSDDLIFAIGKTGADISRDGGKNWSAIGDYGYYAATAVDGERMVYLSGSDGRIAKVRY